jgi:hypothetical protein
VHRASFALSFSEDLAMRMPMTLRRRDALKAGAAAAATAALPFGARAQTSDDEQKFLFVIAANGGGSILDSFLPIVDSESPNGQTIVAYPQALVQKPNGSNLRCVHTTLPLGLPPGYQQTFLQNHAADTAVMTVEGTSVNHIVAGKRAVTGANANRGRTIMEAMALAHGNGMLLPNCNMSESGYLEPGDDATLPGFARGETIADALLFPVATDGIRGVPRSPARDLVERARGVRERLDNQSVFAQTFRASKMLNRYLHTRRSVVPAMEAADLITKLMMVPNIPGQIPLESFGLSSSPEGQRVRQMFPDLLDDPFDAQAALAFLLARYRISCAVTISPSFAPIIEGATLINTPLAFDFSHTQHPLAQYTMWSRMFRAADGLIKLLKEQDFDDTDPSKGKMWDRSLVYFATEFGRDKTRPSGSFEYGTGHNLNNGAILVSPLLNGNRVYGGVDVNTALTYGFDRTTGEPAPGTVMREGDIYGVIAQAMGISYPGQILVPTMIKSV